MVNVCVRTDRVLKCETPIITAIQIKFKSCNLTIQVRGLRDDVPDTLFHRYAEWLNTQMISAFVIRRFDGRLRMESRIQNSIVRHKTFEQALTNHFKKSPSHEAGSGCSPKGTAELCNKGDALFKFQRNTQYLFNKVLFARESRLAIQLRPLPQRTRFKITTFHLLPEESRIAASPSRFCCAALSCVSF